MMFHNTKTLADGLLMAESQPATEKNLTKRLGSNKSIPLI
jgi:hypothetical protein